MTLRQDVSSLPRKGGTEMSFFSWVKNKEVLKVEEYFSFKKTNHYKEFTLFSEIKWRKKLY